MTYPHHSYDNFGMGKIDFENGFLSAMPSPTEKRDRKHNYGKTKNELAMSGVPNTWEQLADKHNKEYSRLYKDYENTDNRQSLDDAMIERSKRDRALASNFFDRDIYHIPYSKNVTNDLDWSNTPFLDSVSVRNNGLLKRAGIHTDEDLLSLYEKEGPEGIFDIPHLGGKGARQLLAYIKYLQRDK